MAIFTVKINYLATITKTVEAEEHGEAFDKARTAAEESDMKEFSIIEELDSEIVGVS